MQNLIFQDLDIVERIRILESNATNVIKGYNYERRLSEEEIEIQRIEFAAAHIKLNKVESDKADLVAEFNDQIKRLKSMANEILQLIKTEREDVTETVYELEDYEEHKIGIYNAAGELISERPMKGNVQRRLNFDIAKAM